MSGKFRNFFMQMLIFINPVIRPLNLKRKSTKFNNFLNLIHKLIKNFLRPNRLLRFKQGHYY